MYVAAESGSDETGDRLLQRLTDVFALLADTPRIGRVRPEVRAGLRSFFSDPFIVFYRPRSDGVYVLRVLHERQDILSQLPATDGS